MTSAPYVPTKAAQQAVAGREVAIVQALGIRWQAGQNDHITCPYPSHGGADDWRLDDKGRAICTCTGNKYDSVFDIVSKVEGIDFEAAKIRCVEIIDRLDLIRRKSGDGGFQATDAASLMQAPIERRDDALPRAYLAHRLGIEPDAVPMPSTSTVGLRSLAYFDPPKGSGKPALVGKYPCAVFGQINAENGRHAHRIYLAHGGAGKADLGQRPDGKSRNPKKSAKNTGEESTAGRSVIWGDPERAEWCLLAEGIETAAAVAYAFRSEIEEGTAYVAAAINANGIEAFEPWPATQRVTVAADRDEAPMPGRPAPTRRGEQAARAFGIRHHEQLGVSVALPGEAGTATDWLDIHGRDGSTAVRAGILAAATFTPKTEEIEAERNRLERIASVQKVTREYPLPPVDSLTLTYQRTKSGKVRVHQAVKVDGNVEMVPFSSPFGVLARLRFADDGDAYGLRLAVEDLGGKRRTIDIARAILAKQGAAELHTLLLAIGLRPENDGEHVAVKYLKVVEPECEIPVLQRPGWHSLDGTDDPYFVCPDGQVLGADDDDIPELSVNAKISATVARNGTLQGWQQAVEAACMAPRCEHWVIGAIAGFCAPILSLCGFDTCGLNLSGTTSSGKTTAQQLAVSAWSRASLNQRQSLLQSAKATANGIEPVAARANGTVLALDELGHVDGKELGRIIYSLASGVGKARMGADAQLRPSYTWATFILLSAEKSIEEKVRGDGGEFAPGMAVRLPDVDTSGINRLVDQAILDQIMGIDRNHGHAGPAFVEALIAAGLHRQARELRRGIDQSARAIAGSGADGKHVRAAIPFAALDTAGRMAQQLGILPRSIAVARAVRWAWSRFTASSDALALDPEQQVVMNLQAWIAERWNSSIHPTTSDDTMRASPRDALGWYDDIAVYIPARRISEAAGGALKEIEIGRALSHQGLIVKRHSNDCFYVSYIPKVGKVKAYALSRGAFGRPSQEPRFEVHQGDRR